MGRSGFGGEGREHSRRAPPVLSMAGIPPAPRAVMIRHGGCSDMIVGHPINGPGSNGWWSMEYGGGPNSVDPTQLNNFFCCGWV